MPRKEDSQFSQEQSQSRQRMEKSEDVLYVDNYGGLNTTSPSVNSPYSDSPEMVNMDVTVSGILKKRNGSFVRKSTSVSPLGYFATPLDLVNGDTLMVIKSGTSLIYEYLPSSDSLVGSTTIATHSNVFTAAASNIKPSFSWVSGANTTRCIMATGVNTIVESEFYQERVTGAGATTIVKAGDFRSFFNTTLSYGLYFDGTDYVVEPVTGVGFAAGSTTFTFGNSVPSGADVALITISWHWWSEALKRSRYQCYGSTFRFNTSAEADANVEVPDAIQVGLESDAALWLNLGLTGLAYGNQLCAVADSNDATGGGFTLDTTPTAATEYAWSQLVYTDSADNITPGTQYLTFGDIAGAGTNPPTPVHFVRQFFLPFNGLQGVSTSNIQVVSSRGLAWVWLDSGTRFANTATTKKFWLYGSNLAVLTSAGTAYALSFYGGYPYGIDEEFIEIINTSATFIGSGAVSTYYSLLVNGSHRPWYGASSYANFFTGEFPSLVGVYQNRVVLSGIPKSPLMAVISNQGNFGSRYNYQNYETTFEDATFSSNPIVIELDGRSDDAITGLISWYDSLFVFTKRTVRRVFGGSAVAVSPTNINQTVISEVGCRAKHGITATDEAVLFISDSGLYRINTNQDAGGFDAQNIGVKIERLFFENSEAVPDVAWVYYNQLTDTVVMGISDLNDSYLTTRVLTYFNRRGAFGEITTHRGFMLSTFGTSNGKRDFIVGVLRDTGVTSAPSTSSVVSLLEFNVKNLNTDYTQVTTSAALASTVTSLVIDPSVVYTIDANQRVVSTLPKEQTSTYSKFGFKMLPLRDFGGYLEVIFNNTVYDIELSLAAGDFSVYPFQYSLYMNILPYTAGGTIKVSLKDDSGNSPIRLIEDNVEVTDATIGTSSGRLTVTYADGDADSVYYIGATIPAWHFTPTLLAELPIQLKRGNHYLGYYDNRPFHDLFTAADANEDADQSTGDVSDKFKVTAGVRVGVLFNDARNGVYDLEVYGSDDLVWDVSLFDLPSTSYRNQINDVVRLVIPILGVGYSVQVCNFNFSLDKFALIGYKVKQKIKGRNTTRWY